MYWPDSKTMNVERNIYFDSTSVNRGEDENECVGLTKVLSYDLPGSFQNGKYAEDNSRQERTKSGTLPVTDKDLASTYVLCCPSPTCP